MVPVNRPNKDGKPSAEGEEGRPMIKENAHQPHTTSTQSETRVSQGLEGVRKAAKENKGTRFTALLHHMSVDLLRESFFALKRKAAPGVDGVTSCDENVRSLFDEQFGCRERHTRSSCRDDCYFAAELAHIFTPFPFPTLDGSVGAVVRAALASF